MIKKGRTYFFDSVEEALDYTSTVLNYQPITPFEDLSGSIIGSMEVIALAGKRSKKGHAEYICKCLSCDSGKLVLKTSKILRKGSTCGCVSLKTEDTIKLLEESGWKVIDQSNGRRDSKWKLECIFGHIRNVYPSNIINMGYGCQECSGKIDKTEDVLINEIKSISRDCSFVSFVGKFDGIKSSIKRQCNTCDKIFTQSASNILYHKNGCPSCAKYGYKNTEPGYFYIQHLKDFDRDFLKFGITNRLPEQRMFQQSNKSVFSHRLLYSHYFNNGCDARSVENIVKNSINIGVVEKEKLPDGYTETCEFNNLGLIMNIINSYSHTIKGEF